MSSTSMAAHVAPLSAVRPKSYESTYFGGPTTVSDTVAAADFAADSDFGASGVVYTVSGPTQSDTPPGPVERTQ